MLPKHWARRVKTQESLQRTLCRASVLLCAVVPFVWLLAATAYWRLPWVSGSYATHVSEMISDTFGVSATVGELKHLTPNRVQIKNLRVSHPETFEVILDVPSLIADKRSGQWSVKMDAPQCAIDQVLKLTRMAHDRFLCRADERLARVSIDATSANLIEHGQLLWKGKADIEFLPESSKSILVMSFERESQKPILQRVVAEDAAKESVTVRFIRNREQVDHWTTTELTVSNMGLPVRLLKDAMPVTRYLGEAATFEGIAVWEHGQQDSMRIKRSLVRNIQWDQVTSELAYHMTGQGNLYIEETTVRNGQLSTASGTLDASEGSISSPWLRKAINATNYGLLGLQIPPDRNLEEGASHQYRNIDMRFELSDQGVRLSGGSRIKAPREDWPLPVMSDVNGPLVYEGGAGGGNRPAPLALSQVVNWICASPNDGTPVEGVTQASYQVSPQPSHVESVKAYLMTVLPQTTIQR